MGKTKLKFAQHRTGQRPGQTPQHIVGTDTGTKYGHVDGLTPDFRRPLQMNRRPKTRQPAGTLDQRRVREAIKHRDPGTATPGQFSSCNAADTSTEHQYMLVFNRAHDHNFWSNVPPHAVA